MRALTVGISLLLAVSMSTGAAAAAWSQERAVITAEAASKSWSWLYRSGATPWTPPLGDVLALEKALPDYIRAELTRQDPRQKTRKDPLWERAKTYKRQ